MCTPYQYTCSTINVNDNGTKKLNCLYFSIKLKKKTSLSIREEYFENSTSVYLINEISIYKKLVL